MKFLNGILGLMLMNFAYSQAKPVFGMLCRRPPPPPPRPPPPPPPPTPNTCFLPKICAQRGFICRTFLNLCNFNEANAVHCMYPERQWKQTKLQECTSDAPSICKSSCPFNKTCSKELNLVCVADKNDNCRLFENLCVLQKYICNNYSSTKGLHDTMMHRCKTAGIVKMGQKAKCGKH